MNSQASAFKLLPSVDKLLQKKSLTGVIEALGHDVVKLKVRSAIERLRTAIAANDIDLIAGLASSDFVDSLCVKIVEDLNQESASTLVAVFNLTGTVIHTNLGRARMPEEAVKAMARAARESP